MRKMKLIAKLSVFEMILMILKAQSKNTNKKRKIPKLQLY